MNDKLKYVNFNVKIIDKKELLEEECIYTFTDYQKFLKSLKPKEDTTYQYINDFTDPGMPSHDFLICNLDIYRSITNESLELGNFVIETIKKQKPKGFVICCSDSLSLYTLYKSLIYSNKGITDNYNTNEICTTQKINHFYFIGLRKDIILQEGKMNRKSIYSFITSVIKTKNSTVINGLALQVKKLRQKLNEVPVSDGRAFEDVVFKVLELSFKDAYKNLDLKPQVRSEHGLTIKDFIIYNVGSENSFLANLNLRGAEFLIFEAKNYKKPISSSDIAMFLNYINTNNHYGKLGILISRSGIDENLKQYTNTYPGLIILMLNEEDLLKMLDLIEIGGNPISIIEEKYKNLIRSIP